MGAFRGRLARLFGSPESQGSAPDTVRGRAHSRADRLNRRLLPFFGPAQVGPYDEPVGQSEPEDAVCAECGQPMSLHRVDRTGGRSRVYCPTP
jgi:hypothetical protein